MFSESNGNRRGNWCWLMKAFFVMSRWNANTKAIRIQKKSFIQQTKLLTSSLIGGVNQRILITLQDIKNTIKTQSGFPAILRLATRIWVGAILEYEQKWYLIYPICYSIKQKETYLANNLPFVYIWWANFIDQYLFHSIQAS